MDETQHGTENQGFSTFKAATASSRLRRLAVVAAVFAAMSGAPAQADQWSLLLNGKAVHLEKRPGVQYNEENWGIGVQYDFKMTESKWIPFLTASGFKDSHENPSYYAGGGALRRFSFGEEKTSVHLDAGVVAFLMTRKDYNDDKPFPGLLPVVSFGTDRVALNITYIPKVDPKMVPILFFQLKIGLN
jgi:Antimicrobial peptide resistance and lipid A acylation protein PagP